jgi:hypothetical protein
LFPFLCSLALWASLSRAATPQELALQPYTAPPAPEAGAWPRERLLGFMRELADFVEKNHVVTDPSRKTYGMVYEFWRDGKKMQEFGLDSMEDGAWFMSSLVTAQRADPGGDWLTRAQKYEVPFYTNLLNHSDQLFPQMQPTDEDKHAWSAPLKGWAPRGWDDGLGFNRKDGSRLADAYFTGSNHLAQDLADALLNVWLSTRDPQVAEAAKNLQQYKQEYFGDVQGVEIAAAVSAGQAGAFLKSHWPEFSPRAVAPVYSGLFENKAAALPTYDDALAWLYREGTAGAWLSGELPRGLAAHTIARSYGAIAAMESFFDDRPYPYGAWLFDLQREPAYAEGKGKLDFYNSNFPGVYGSRGIQLAWIAAAVLPELKAQPGLWNNALKLNPADVAVRMVDEPPITDGVKDAVYARSGALGDDSARVTLVSDPRNLHIFIETVRPQLTVTFQEENGDPRPIKATASEGKSVPSPPRHRVQARARHSSDDDDDDDDDKPAKKKKKGSAAREKEKEREKEKAENHAPPEPVFVRGGKLTVTKDGQCTVVNEKGETLLAASAFKAAAFKQGEGEGWYAEVRIPYTFVPAQNAWINGVDFGRYKVGIDNAPPQTICILSDSDRIRKRLENCVLGTIAYWHRVWEERGLIPSGWHTSTAVASGWDLSDAGGYAHLINTIALWLIYQDGHREWEIIREQFPTVPKPAQSLPSSVLKAQGLLP